MQTLQLRSLQMPSNVSGLLEGLIAARGFLPESAYQIRDPAQMPRQLLRAAIEATAHGRVWSCWADGFHTALFTGEMSLPQSRERGVPVLNVDRYDDEGLRDSGAWMRDRDGNWARCNR